MTFYKPQYNKTFPSKTTEIKQAMERKERGIADYTTKQEVSIAVQSALRDSFLWCINHPDWKENQTDEARLEWVDDTAKRLVRFYADKKIEYAELYENLKGRHREVEEKEELSEAIEIGSDEPREEGGETFDEHLESIKK